MSWFSFWTSFPGRRLLSCCLRVSTWNQRAEYNKLAETADRQRIAKMRNKHRLKVSLFPGWYPLNYFQNSGFQLQKKQTKFLGKIFAKNVLLSCKDRHFQTLGRILDVLSCWPLGCVALPHLAPSWTKPQPRYSQLETKRELDTFGKSHPSRSFSKYILYTLYLLAS